MSDTLQLKEFACPGCGARSRLDARFVQWCTDCGHGADPAAPQPGQRERRRLEREAQRSTRLYESLRTARDLRPTSAVGLWVTAISALVYLCALLLIVSPILLVVATHGFWLSYLVLLLCLLAYAVVRPRLLARLRRPSWAGLERAMAPSFYALLDRCAAEIGCAVPERVRFDARFNASTGRFGLRGRTTLTLGLPLWTVASGPERVALLGHELAHQVNGDATHGLWADSARRSLDEWMRLLNPRQTRLERHVAHVRMRGMRSRGGNPGFLAAVLAPVAMAILLAPFFLAAFGCRVLLTRLDLYCGQRAEYLADELGARLAGSEAMYALLSTLALGDSVSGYLTAARNRARARRGSSSKDADLWQGLLRHVASVPETERQRLTVVDRLRNTRTDRSHPANHLRIALVRDRAQLPARLVLSDGEWAAIDAELAGGYQVAARMLLAA